MPILDANTFEFISRSADQTRRLGMRLGGLLKSGDLICLDGDLGAGKTTFVQGVASGWGSQDDVTSPTYVIVNVYRRADDLLLSHMDAYRLETSADLAIIDIEELLVSGSLIIEWAPKIISSLPEEHLYITFSHDDEETRQLRFNAIGQSYEKLLSDLQQKVIGGG